MLQIFCIFTFTKCDSLKKAHFNAFAGAFLLAFVFRFSQSFVTMRLRLQVLLQIFTLGQAFANSNEEKRREGSKKGLPLNTVLQFFQNKNRVIILYNTVFPLKSQKFAKDYRNIPKYFKLLNSNSMRKCYVKLAFDISKRCIFFQILN